MKSNRKIWPIAWMLFGLFVFLLGPIIALSGTAHAGIFSPGMPANPAIQKAARVNACYNISDTDARTMCLARAHREPGQCYSIQRADLRTQCLAEVQR